MASDPKFQSPVTEVLSNDHELLKFSFLNADRLNFEEERKKSFASWPVHFPVDPNRLAKAGFYYVGIDDEVVCFSCRGRIKNWNYGDVVLKKHAEFFPNCPFIQNKSNNVPFTKISIKSERQQVTENIDNVTSSNLPYKSKINDTVMKLESERLKTFTEKWPLPYINIVDLAQAGFYYMGIDDKVQCAYCKGIISNWESGDIPFQEHMKHFPYCDYVSENIIKDNEESCWFKLKSEDVCGNMEEHYPSSNNASSSRLIDINQQHMNLEDLGVHLHRGPAHPQQTSLAARLRTFLSWPYNAPVSKEDLAAAGFFYIGISDHAKCFYCNGGLCNWEEGDDPWVEHARWFCNCDFLRSSKGSDFIKSCMSKKPVQDVKENGLKSVEPLLRKVDEAMQSNLVKYVLETELYPPYIVRAAVLLQIKETDRSFSSMDDLCMAVSYLKEEMEKEPSNAKSTKAADLSIYENIVQNCGIASASQLEENRCSESSNSSHSQQTKIANNGHFEKSTNQAVEDTSKDHCLCKICMDNEVGVVFLPCGHLLSCTVCAPALRYCPMCRKTIQATVRAYLN